VAIIILKVVSMYYCTICNYKTKNRKEMDKHHIVPRELHGSNKPFNIVLLCRQCHSKVFVEDSSSGIHSIKSDGSITIIGWFKSTLDNVLLIEINGIKQYKNVRID
jgi:hypothetical protein